MAEWRAAQAAGALATGESLQDILNITATAEAFAVTARGRPSSAR